MFWPLAIVCPAPWWARNEQRPCASAPVAAPSAGTAIATSKAAAKMKAKSFLRMIEFSLSGWKSGHFVMLIAALLLLPAITPSYSLAPGSTAAVKQRGPGLVFPENPDLPGLSEIAIAVAVDEYGAAIGSTVTSGVPQEKGAYGVGTHLRDGERHPDVDVGSDHK